MNDFILAFLVVAENKYCDFCCTPAYNFGIEVTYGVANAALLSFLYFDKKI